jgi:hypothetical protein
MGGKMSHKLFDIWEQSDPKYPKLSWRAEMVNYTALFETKEAAESFVARIRKNREAAGLSKIPKIK